MYPPPQLEQSELQVCSKLVWEKVDGRTKERQVVEAKSALSFEK